MMGTRAAAFAGKISNLRDSTLRIQNNTMPQPTCIDLANMLKYFCQVFHDFRDFKDIENIPLYASEKKDRLELINKLPNFDYSGLYKALAQLVDILPLIPQPSTGYEQLCTNLLLLFKCLVPFLDQANMETMPYLVSTLFISYPQSMHKMILDTLCFNLLPFTNDQQQRNATRMLRKATRRRNQAMGVQQLDAKSSSEGATSRPFHCIVRIEDSSKQLEPSTMRKSKRDAKQKLDEDKDQGIELADEPDSSASSSSSTASPSMMSSSSSSSDENEYAMLSVTSILMVSFHYIQEPMHHSQLIECLMKLKSNVFEDLLYVIAYGTTRARCPAVEILFRYWPDICPITGDRKNNNQSSSKLKHVAWQPMKCQNKNCSFTTLEDDEAVKMCMDFRLSIILSGAPPPMLVCLDCVDSIYRQQSALMEAHASPSNAPGFPSMGSPDQSAPADRCDIVASSTASPPPPPPPHLSHLQLQPQQLQSQSRPPTQAQPEAPLATTNGRQHHTGIEAQMDIDYSNKFLDLLLPMERVSKLCENKKCKSSQDRVAVGTCFDIECANYNGKKPIRYCKTCYLTMHEPCETNNFDPTPQNHIRHSSLSLNIMESDEGVNNFVEAIISLLKEAAPAEKPSKDSERHLRSLMGPMSQFSMDNRDMNTIATEEKQLISQYGIWLMTGLCKSVDRLSDELLGRLLGMLFQWFHFTACLPDDQAGSALEKLKGECIKGWIMEVKTKRLDVFISCLLPHPIDCSKIGGHWEVWPDNAHQIKEGFKRLLCLVPYDIITDDVWDEIMPYWMECFRHEVPENELNELKILLSKVFDPELSPLGFETKQMYNFISSRFEDTTNSNQEQTLYWLQIITMLEIPIPVNFLYQMLRSGVKSLGQLRANELNKIKMVRRLRELNEQARKSGRAKKRPARKSSAGSGGAKGVEGSAENGEEEEDDNDEEDEDSEASAMSVAEDDVMMPNEPTSCESQGAMAAAEARELSRRERQAQARAAFSAKLTQQASMLDAQHGGSRAPQGSLSASTSASGAMAGPQLAGQLAGAASSSAAQLTTAPLAPAKSQTTTTASLAPLASGESSPASPAPAHSRRLKSTTRDHQKRVQTDSAKTKEKVPVGGPAAGEEEEEEAANLSKIDNNLVCYILMMDILLKQLDLQEINSHRGLDGKEAQQAIELLNSIIATPWLGKHTCCDSLPYTNSPTGQQQAQQQSQQQSQSQQKQTPSASSNAFLSSAANQAATRGASVESSSTSAGKESQQLDPDSSRQDVFYSNIHSFSHCAQGFEHEDSYETCVFCEIISTFFQLAMSLVEFFSPVIEVSICELSQEAANGEFDGTPDYSRIGLDHLGPSPREQNTEFEFQFEFPDQTAPASLQRLQLQQDPTSPFSPSYSGPTLKAEVLESLPKELQLSYNLLVQFHQYQTPDIVSQLLQMIKLVSLHSQVLSKAAKEHAHFISWCQHNMLVNKLWSLCQLESSEIARTCVPLLLHCITLPWGVRLFRDLVERDFNSDNWLARFRAVERVVTIAYFCEPSTIKISTLLQSSMASAFCHVVRCLDDIEAIVAQRALVSLEMMKTSSLKLLLWCLEVQFDCITIDRSIILRSVFQLYNHLRDRRFLTWEFFLNRFDTIFLEAQIYLQQTGEIPSFTMQDLKNTNTKSEIYQKKIARAKEALHETHHSRSLSARFQNLQKFAPTAAAEQCRDYKQSIEMQKQQHQQHQLQRSASPNANANEPPAPSDKTRPPARRVLQHGKSTSSRYQSIAFLTSQSLARRKNSKFMSNLALQSVPPLMSLPDKLHQHLPNSFVEDGSKLNEIAQENHVFGVVHRVCDEDRDTNHSLVFLLMQFFSKHDPSHPQSSKTLNRSHQIVLKHLNILMGYSMARKNFLISASNLRLLPVFNAFLTSLPKVLDFNYTLGGILLDTCLPVLIYCPAQDTVQFDSIRRPSYSLWLLNPLMRQNWLLSVMTFLYKYQFNQPHLKDQVNMLIWIIINTLESHLNTTLSDVVVPPPQPQPQPPPQPQPQPPAPSSSQEAPFSTPTSWSLDQNKGHVARVALADSQPTDGRETGVPPATESGARSNEAHSASSSPRTVVRKRAFESIEMDSVREEPLPVSVISTSVSSVSLKQQTTEFSKSSKPLITKADTTDNLTSRSKIFQEQQDVAAPVSHSSSARIDMAQQAKREQDKSDFGKEERLLPIGPGGQLAAHQPRSKQLAGHASTSANVERLLPIGYAPTITQVPTVLSKDTQTSPINEGPLASKIMESSAKKMAASKFEESEPQQSAMGSSREFPRPLQGLRANLAQSFVQTSQAATTSNGAQNQSPKSPASMVASKKLARDDELQAAPFVSGSKAARLTGGRFGASKQSSSSDTRLFQMARQQEQQEQQLEHGGESGGSGGGGGGGGKGAIGALVGGARRNKLANKFQSKDYSAKQLNVASLKQSFSSPSLLNEQLAQVNRHSCVQEFSDKDLSMCLVILETFIHHEPSMAAQMLPNILRLVARYSSSIFESWQTGSSAHLVGGSMFVARQFIRVALHDLMENNIFHQIFTSHFTGYEFYRSMSTALADFSDLNQLAPLSKLFEDLNKQKNLPSVASLMTILENVATYFECITQDGPTSHSQATWNQFIINWENFLRKLILALPRFTGNWANESSARAAAAAASLANRVSITPASTDAGPASSSSTSTTTASTAHQGAPLAGSAPTSMGAQGASSTGSGVSGKSQLPGGASAPGSLSLNQQHGSHEKQQQPQASGSTIGAQVESNRARPSSCSMIMAPIMRIILATTKVPHLAACKTIVDPYSKIISYTVLNSQFKYEHLLEISHNCCRLYTRDREKYLIQRSIAYELVQVLKFRFFILEENLLLLLLFVLQDVGGTLPTKMLTDGLKLDGATLNLADSYITNVSECLRQHMGDLLEFVTDVHAISRINDNLVGSRPSSINRDSFGGHVKAAVSQYLALEISLSHSGDQRTIARYLPWLYNSPSLQQGPREFIDCVSHIRQLSWLILGSLQHSALIRDQMALTGPSCSPADQQQAQFSTSALSSSPPTFHQNAGVQCQPIPIEKNNNIAEHVQVILAGFAEQSKESVLHMSSLYNAFLLCQLWTMYCENICAQHAPNSEQYQYCQSTLDEFWAKITPGVLRLVGHSRMMSDMVSSHFLQLIESLIESESSILIRYLPMWNSIFYSYRRRNKSSIQVAIRLQKCFEWQPPDLSEHDLELNRRRFINWLEKVQYKMSHIEIQSSQATPYYLS